MQIPVVVERVNGNGFRARSYEPFNVTGEGATMQEALRNLRKQIESWIPVGGRLVPLNIRSDDDNPWEAIRGTWDKNDPALQRWKELVEEYRRKIDEDSSIP